MNSALAPVLPNPDVGFLNRVISVTDKFSKFPQIPVSLYHQTLSTIIRLNIDHKSSILPNKLKKDLKDWETIFPRRFFLKKEGSSEIPIFLELAHNISQNVIPELIQRGYNLDTILSRVEVANVVSNPKFQRIRHLSNGVFLDTLKIALKNVGSIPFLRKLPLSSYSINSAAGIEILRKACLTESYPLVLYWVKIVTLHSNLFFSNPTKLIREVLEIYFKSLSDPEIKKDRKYLDQPRKIWLKLICQLLENMYGFDILRSQMIVAAKIDDLNIIKSIRLKRGEYIRPSIISRGSYDENIISLAACQSGSLSVIKYLLPTLQDNWKENQPYACAVAESGKIPALEYFLQRRHRISPMLIRAITTANIRSFAFLFLVMTQDSSKMTFLNTTFGSRLMRYFNPDKVNLGYYIILRYLVITKLNLGMKVGAEMKAIVYLKDTQLMEYINFRTKFKNKKEDPIELNKKIGFSLDQSWVDQFDSVNQVNKAAFEMLLESKCYIKRGISRLINSRENFPSLINLEWALARSIEAGNSIIETAIRAKLNPLMSPVQSVPKLKRPREEIKNKKTVFFGRPKKISKLS